MRHVLSRLATAFALAVALVAPGIAAAQTSCATGPGSGSTNTAVTGIVNSYYPGSGTSGAGNKSVNVGAISGSGAATPIAAGDLILIIQIQDAFISTTNGTAYGGSGGGGGYTSLNNAGRYEYAVATGPASAGSVPIASGLLYTYTESAANGTNGQRAYEVIRVPQYSSATVTGTVTAPPWDGSIGGVVAFDVAGQLTWADRQST